MGQNLVLNMADHGYRVAVYNRTTSKVDDFINGPARGKNITGTHSIEELVAALQKPRKVMLMGQAGPAVAAFNGISGGEEGARAMVRRSCPAATRKPGRWSRIFSSQLPQKWMASPAANGSDRMVPVTSSKWCTTASSTAICN